MEEGRGNPNHLSRGSQPPTDLPPELLNPETEASVDALVDTVRDLLKEETARDQSFNGRGVGLAGFVGIIVSLSTTVGRDALAASWGRPWRGIAVVLFALVLLSLVGTVIVVVRGVLMPREAATLALDEVQKYPLPEYVYAPKVFNQGKTLRGLIAALIIERARATSKAGGLRWGYRFLILGLSSIAIMGFLLGLHDAKLIGVRHAGKSRPAQSTPVGPGSRPGRGAAQPPARR